MKFKIRYNKGVGNAAVYGRITNDGQYWNFNTHSWVGVESVDTKVYMTEYADSDLQESWFSAAIPNIPLGGPYTQEAVLASTGGVLGSDDIMGELSGVPDLTGCTEIERTQFLAQYFAFKRTATDTDEKMYNSSGTQLATATLTDDNTTFTKNKIS